MAAGVHSDGYHFNPAVATELEAVLHQAAQDALAAARAWAATAPDGVEGYGEKVGAEYRSKVVEPATRSHAAICDGLAEWARQVQAWSTSTTDADQDAAAGFGGGVPAAQPGPIQTS